MLKTIIFHDKLKKKINERRAAMTTFEELEKINKDFAVTPFADALEIDFMKEGVPLFDDLSPVLYCYCSVSMALQ